MDVKEYLRLMRPAQWYKNALVFLAIIFYETPLERPWPTGYVPAILDLSKFYIFHLPLILGFIIFCAVASATYIINDIKDLEADAVHPEKRNRPLPSGTVSRSHALVLAFILLAIGLLGSILLNWLFFVMILLYIVNSQLYNAYLRKWAIVDVVTIGIGFILRAISGAILIQAPFTSWLIIGVFFFALVLGFGKRKNELQYLDEDAIAHKPVFKQYTSEILDHGITMSATWFVFFYTMYCYNVFGDNFEDQPVLLTVPIMAGLILRYVYLIHIGSPVGRKPHLAFLDKGILIGAILFVITLAWTLFFWNIIYDFVENLFLTLLT